MQPSGCGVQHAGGRLHDDAHQALADATEEAAKAGALSALHRFAHQAADAVDEATDEVFAAGTEGRLLVRALAALLLELLVGGEGGHAGAQAVADATEGSRRSAHQISGQRVNAGGDALGKLLRADDDAGGRLVEEVAHSSGDVAGQLTGVADNVQAEDQLVQLRGDLQCVVVGNGLDQFLIAARPLRALKVVQLEERPVDLRQRQSGEADSGVHKCGHLSLGQVAHGDAQVQLHGAQQQVVVVGLAHAKVLHLHEGVVLK